MNHIMSDEDIKKAVFEASGVSIEMVETKVRSLKKRLKKVKHLPETPSLYMLETFLLMNKFDIDKTQKKIEMYYQVRTDYPEIFRNKNPSLPHMQKIADQVYLFTLPQMTSELYRVTLLKLKDTNPRNLDVHNFVAHMFNCLELNFASGKYAVGELYIYDLEGASLRHLFVFGMGLIRKLARIMQDVYSQKMREIHFINCPFFIDSVLTIARAVMKKKVADRIRAHKTNESLKQFVPVNILPKDYGGQEECLESLRNIQQEQFLKYIDRFNDLDNLMKTKINSD